MTGFSIFDALSDIKDEYLAESETRTAKKRPALPKWSRIAAAAACVCLLAGGAAVALYPATHHGHPVGWRAVEPQADSENGVFLPNPQINLNAKIGETAQMIGFFIWGGRYYEVYAWDNTWTAGEYVCTSNGLIDEWTQKDGYVDGAGSVPGDFYAVEGYDPDFLLCSPVGGVLYINNAGMHLTQGSEILSERFHMTETETDIRFLSREDWFYSLRDWQEVPEDALPAVQELLTVLTDAPFIYTDEVPLPDGQSSIYDTLECCHIEVMTADGVPVHLRLCRGGYVLIECFRDICLQIPENGLPAYEAALTALGIEP